MLKADKRFCGADEALDWLELRNLPERRGVAPKPERNRVCSQRSFAALNAAQTRLYVAL